MKLFALILMLPIVALSQVEQKKPDQKTKMDEFESRTGSILRFVDKKLPPFKGGFASAETRIRVITSNSTSGYFYQIIKKGEYGNKTASIEYSDLLEVIQALKVLKEDAIKDAGGSNDYLENKFVTDDGFQVGYFANKGKVSWYLVLEKYGSGNTVFIDDFDTIDKAFAEAKSTIETLKK